MKRTLSIAKAKAHFADCVRRAEAGETLILTRHGRPVARLEPMEPHDERRPGEIREVPRPYEVGRRSPVQTVAAAPESRREALERLLEECVWPRVPASQIGSVPGKREREKILGYGDDGV